MRSLIFITFAGAALAQQFLDDEVAPAVKTEADFSTTADITNGTNLPTLTGSTSGGVVPNITVAKTGYTIGGTEDAPTITATMDIRVVLPGVTIADQHNLWITWSTVESGMMHVYSLQYLQEITGWLLYYGQLAGSQAPDPAIVSGATFSDSVGQDGTAQYRRVKDTDVEQDFDNPPDATWAWMIGDSKVVNSNTVDFQIKLESSDSAVVASYRAGMTRQDKLGVNFKDASSSASTGIGGPVTINYAQDPAVATTPDAASMLTVSTALSLITAASLALF